MTKRKRGDDGGDEELFLSLKREGRVVEIGWSSGKILYPQDLEMKGNYGPFHLAPVEVQFGGSHLLTPCLSMWQVEQLAEVLNNNFARQFYSELLQAKRISRPLTGRGNPLIVTDTRSYAEVVRRPPLPGYEEAGGFLMRLLSGVEAHPERQLEGPQAFCYEIFLEQRTVGWSILSVFQSREALGEVLQKFGGLRLLEAWEYHNRVTPCSDPAILEHVRKTRND